MNDIMEYQIEYRIVSGFTAQVDADSEQEAREKFMKMNMRIEVSDNILDGGLAQDEIEITSID